MPSRSKFEDKAFVSYFISLKTSRISPISASMLPGELPSLVDDEDSDLS